MKSLFCYKIFIWHFLSLFLASCLLACLEKAKAYLFNLELKRFLIALSVLPGSNLAISHHLLPSLLCISTIIWSSSKFHFSFLIFGSRWLCHLSRHCLPILPGREEAIVLQFLGPCSYTRALKILSSLSDQGPLDMNWVFYNSSHLL